MTCLCGYSAVVKLQHMYSHDSESVAVGTNCALGPAKVKYDTLNQC